MNDQAMKNQKKPYKTGSRHDSLRNLGKALIALR